MFLPILCALHAHAAKLWQVTGDACVAGCGCCHATGKYSCAMMQSAQKEIALWFKPEELAEYNVVTKGAIYE